MVQWLDGSMVGWFSGWMVQWLDGSVVERLDDLKVVSMAKVEHFEDLDVWQNSRRLAGVIYRLTQSELFARDFGLKDQIRRAAVSIVSNIAEGFESQTQATFIDYLGRAKASAGEVRAQLYLAMDLEYLNQNEFDEAYSLVVICSKQLVRFIQYLRSQPNARRVNEEEAAYDI
jgi:four helix bundle protein